MQIDLLTTTASDVKSALSSGSLTSKDLFRFYLSQIPRHNDYLKAVVATTPEEVLYSEASKLDGERAMDQPADHSMAFHSSSRFVGKIVQQL
jgi:amidase